MSSSNNKLDIEIRIARNENLYDLNLCANDFIDFIDNFEEMFINKELFILTAYNIDVLVGILVAEDKTKIIDSIENLLPKTCLHLVYVNSNYRKNNIGTNLLNSFIDIQKKNGIALIQSILPQKYITGINFLQKNNFYPKEKIHNKVILELKLWDDYGVSDCNIIEDNYDDRFFF